MKNIKLILLSILFLNASCAQKDKTIVSPKINNYELVNVFEKVDIPWSIEFLDEETIVYAEKKGEIFIIKDGKSTKIQNVPEVYLRGQGGLLDLELHPNFSENKLIYMSYASGSRDEGGGNTAICRAKLIGNQLVDVKLLYKAEGNSTKGQHFGSRLQFDNNGKLFFAIGDRGNRDKLPQDLTLDGGKIYRINDDGTIPNDNPFFNEKNSKKAIYSYGHRNPQGMFLHPKTGEIWTNEHGPKGGDEINIINKGKNYGWPKITYGINYSGTIITNEKEHPEMEQPLYYWIPSIAPSGFTYVSTKRYKGWKGSLLTGSLKFKYLERIKLNKNNKVIYREKVADSIGRVRDVKESPDGFIYIAVENKGIFKIVPKK
ncbi:MAG: PQQ-dependent sugar dehydrogenase [Flavobacteriaceae bacterium]